MNHTEFTDEITLPERAEKLGEVALMMGLVNSFVVRHFPDSWEFYIPDETAHKLTPEEAYLYFKQLVDLSGRNIDSAERRLRQRLTTAGISPTQY